jgi:crossover junction endodeoxyribonuclease RusA
MTPAPITIRLPWPPSVNHYWRQFRGRSILSEAGRRYRKDAEAAIVKAGVRAPLQGHVAIRLRAVFPDRRRRDLDNLPKAVLDALGRGKTYRDDSQIKLLIIEHVGTEKPGWIDVTLGPKPGKYQGSLFELPW